MTVLICNDNCLLGFSVISTSGRIHPHLLLADWTMIMKPPVPRRLSFSTDSALIASWSTSSITYY